MCVRKVLCLLLVLVGVSIADTIWGPVPLSEPDTVLPKAYPAADANDKGEYAVAWFDCRDGGWPKEVRWFSRFLGRVDKNGSALVPNHLLDPPGWITEPTGGDTDVLLFDDGSYWTLSLKGSPKPKVYFWSSDDGLEAELELYGVSNEWSWAKTGNGEAVLGERNGSALDLWFLSKGSLDTTIELGVVGTSPQIAVDDNGEILIAYENEGEVYWLRCDAEGEMITDPVQVASGEVGDIVWGEQGRLLVVWKSQNYPYHPCAQVYLKAGNPIGDVQVLDSETCRGRPVAASSFQKYLVTWVKGDADGPQGVWGSILNLNGEVVVPPIEMSEHVEGNSLVLWCWAHGNDKGYTVMWLQDNHVYGKRLNEGGGTVTGPYKVNDDELGSVTGWSEVALAPDGSGFLIWAPFKQHEFFSRVFLRHFSTQGQGGETWRKESAGGNSRETLEGYSLALNPKGGAWMSYGMEDEDDDIGRIMLQRFDAQGNPIGEEITVYTNTGWPQNKFNTAVAVNVSGEGTVLWRDEYRDLWAQLINPNGTLKGNPFVAIEDIDLRYCLEVQYFEDGGFVVMAEEGSSLRPVIRMFDASGNPQGEPFYADTGLHAQDGHSLATNGDDRFVVVRANDHSDGYTKTYYFAQVFNRQGVKIGPLVYDTILLPYYHWLRNPRHFSSAVAMDTTGNWVVAWTEAPDANLENPMIVRGQMYDRDGNKLGARFSIPDTFPGYERFQGTNSLAAAGGKLLYTWYGSADHRGVEVYGLLTDWPTPPAVSEPAPVPQPSDWHITQSVGHQIVLQYSNSPQGFAADIFDVTGRKVDELHAPEPSRVILWGQGQPTGVYFIVPQASNLIARKVVLVR
jgi:hypothetical protein